MNAFGAIAVRGIVFGAEAAEVKRFPRKKHTQSEENSSYTEAADTGVVMNCNTS